MYWYKYSRARHKTFPESFLHEVWEQEALAESDSEGRQSTGTSARITPKSQKSFQMLSDHKPKHIQTHIICVWSSALVHTHHAQAVNKRCEQYETDIYSPQRSKSNEYKANRSIQPVYWRTVYVLPLTHWFLRSAVMLIISSHLGLLFI